MHVQRLHTRHYHSSVPVWPGQVDTDRAMVGVLERVVLGPAGKERGDGTSPSVTGGATRVRRRHLVDQILEVILPRHLGQHRVEQIGCFALRQPCGDVM